MNHKISTKRRKLPQLANTLHGIEEWYSHIFKHLGWIVLAAGKGNTKKVDAYKHSLEQFVEVVDHVASEYEDPDRLHDMNVMKMHVEYLLSFLDEIGI